MSVDIFAEIKDSPHARRLKFEVWLGNAFYGNGAILKKYAKLPWWVPLKFHTQHGVKFFSLAEEGDIKKQLSFYLPKDNNTPFLIFNKREAEFLRARLGNRTNIQVIGAPIIYLDPYIEGTKKSLPDLEKKGTIAFPSKGTHYSNVVTDYTEYADMLDALPEKFKPIKVCMYYLDRERGKDKPFLEKGFEVVDNGKLLSQNFLQKFYYNTLSAEYSTSNDLLSSPVFYSIYSGLKFFEYGPNVKYEQLINDKHSFYAKEREMSQKISLYHFPIEEVEDYQKMKRIADLELGLDYKLSPAQLRKFILRQLNLSFLSKHIRKNIRTLYHGMVS